MIEAVAKLLDMPFIRVLEVATFYTMFNLEPVGRISVQVCTTHALLAARFRRRRGVLQEAHPRPAHVSADGKFSWMEVECLGACVNAPMMQIGKDFYEDLDGADRGKVDRSLAPRRKAEARPADGPPFSPSPQAGRRR